MASITSATASVGSEVTLDLYVLPFGSGVTAIDATVAYDPEWLVPVSCAPVFSGKCDAHIEPGVMRLSTAWPHGLNGNIGAFTFKTGESTGITPVTVEVQACKGPEGEPWTCGGSVGEITVTGSPTPVESPQPTATPEPEPTQSPTPTPAPAPTIQGDGSCDGVIDSSDALVAQREAAGLPLQLTYECIAQTDVDCNGAITSVDALRILRHVANLPVNYLQGCPPIGS